MFKIGIGPSSSHTMGPWRSAQLFLSELNEAGLLPSVSSLTVELYGSLAKTGKGHATDLGVQLGLSSEDFTTIDSQRISELISKIAENKSLNLAGQFPIPFLPERDILFLKDQQKNNLEKSS